MKTFMAILLVPMVSSHLWMASLTLLTNSQHSHFSCRRCSNVHGIIIEVLLLLLCFTSKSTSKSITQSKVMKASFGISLGLALLNGLITASAFASFAFQSKTSLIVISAHQDDNPQSHLPEVATRRDFFLKKTATSILSVATLASVARPLPAFAGSSANIEMPNYIDFLIEKNNQGLAADPDKVLYKGADPTVLLRRVQEADRRLAEIESLVEQKKWSQVSGLVTGPLGTLSQTLNQIATPDSGKAVLQAAKKVKSDILAIGQASSQKNGPACVAASNQAIQDLEAFIKVSFCDNKTMVCFDMKNVE